MATSLSLENDPSLAQGYIKVNGTTAATITTSGIAANLTGNADTATKFSTTTGSAPAYACRAWVNFDGTRDTTGAVSTANTNRLIRASGNVTSVLRNGTGDYTITFTTAMSDANYSVSFSNVGVNLTNTTYNTVIAGTAAGGANLKTVNQIRISTGATNASVMTDLSEVSVAIFGN
jgi:hypothetical protein